MRKEQRGEKSGQLRIIAGQWRGRRLSFPTIPGLRPTGDRIRETLFNWLAPEIAGAQCLDLFAGSGALGLEGLSRGAMHCDFVERDARAAAVLRAHLEALGGAARGRVLCDDAEIFLNHGAAKTPAYDIVFLDPPFSQDLLTRTCESLLRSGKLSSDALIYLEYGTRQTPALPAAWPELRSKQTGDVVYSLHRVRASE